MHAMNTLQFQVRKDALASTRTVELNDTALAPGQVRVAVRHFAYTANNITYGAFGDAMGYWQFFPVEPEAHADTATDHDVDRDRAVAWGCIPVWGFGEVVESRDPGVAVGERYYGYWPMASHAVLQPVRHSPHGFFDGAPHRANLSAVYNQYLRCAGDPFYTPDTEAAQALLRPLFLTAWLIDDFLADNHFFGTCTLGQRGVMLLSSASSKTACATAALLARRSDVEVVGLTSPVHQAFCESLGIYSRVLTYAQLETWPADQPLVYVDFAGNSVLRRAVHTRFTRLAYSCSIGGTHVDQLGSARDLPGPKPVLFFAPAQAKKRSAEWGAPLFNQRLVAAWQAFLAQATDPAAPWLVPQWHTGAAAVQAAHALVMGGQADPRLGHMLSLNSAD
jgi:hypothetical protein